MEFTGRTRVGPLKLEGAETIYVLYRIEEGGVQRIRVASPECPLDAGGLTLHWLTGVRAADSIDWLAALAPETVRDGWPRRPPWRLPCTETCRPPSA